MKRHATVYVLLVAMGLSLVVTAGPAAASVRGRRNAATAVTGAAAYELLRGHTGTGLLLGAGAAYAWKRAKDESRHRHHYAAYPARSRHATAYRVSTARTERGHRHHHHVRTVRVRGHRAMARVHT
jgi:hypothetical protein